MAKSRHYTPTEYFEGRLSDTASSLKFPVSSSGEKEKVTKEQYEDWRVKMMQSFRARIVGPLPERVPLDVEILEVEEREGYTQTKVVYQSEDYASIPAYLLTPEDLKRGEKRPAILALHGHGNGKSDVVGLDFGEENRARLIRQLNYDYAVQLVRRGYVTLSPDFRGFGERVDHPADPLSLGRDPCNVNYMRATLLGLQMLTLNIHDFMVSIDYLETRPEVDTNRIGCMGLSFGGSMTLYGAAIDPRIKTAIISCGLFSMRDHSVVRSGMCGSQLIPNHLLIGDISEVVGLIAPRPLLCEIGEKDSCFSIDTALPAYREVEAIYTAAGVPEKIELDLFEGEHQFSGKKAFDWFKRWL